MPYKAFQALVDGRKIVIGVFSFRVQTGTYKITKCS